MDHMTESEEHLFDLKYLEDINRLFLDLKKLDERLLQYKYYSRILMNP